MQAIVLVYHDEKSQNRNRKKLVNMRSPAFPGEYLRIEFLAPL